MPLPHFAWWNTLQQPPIEGMSSFSHAIGHSFAEMKMLAHGRCSLISINALEADCTEVRP